MPQAVSFDEEDQRWAFARSWTSFRKIVGLSLAGFRCKCFEHRYREQWAGGFLVCTDTRSTLLIC
jgi:hypothetical protein